MFVKFASSISNTVRNSSFSSSPHLFISSLPHPIPIPLHTISSWFRDANPLVGSDLPVQVRDSVNPNAGPNAQVPESEVSKLWLAAQNEQAVSEGKYDHRKLPSQDLLKMART